jgi:hypothetical protein
MNVPESELLSAYLDGEVTAAEQARAEELLAADPQARRFVDSLRALRVRFQDLPLEKLDENLSQRILAAAEDRSRSAAAARPAPAEQPWWREHSWRGMFSRRALVWSGLAVAIAAMIAINESQQPKPHAGRDMARAPERAPAPAAQPPTMDDLARAPEGARRWDEPPELRPLGPSRGAAAGGPPSAVAKPSALANKLAKSEGKSSALAREVAKSEMKPLALAGKDAESEQERAAVASEVEGSKEKSSDAGDQVAGFKEKPSALGDKVAGPAASIEKPVAPADEAAKFKSDGRLAEVAAAEMKKAQTAPAPGAGGTNLRLHDQPDKPAATDLALGSIDSDRRKGRGAAADKIAGRIEEAAKPGAGPRPPAAPPGSQPPRPDLGSVARMSGTPRGQTEAGLDMKVAGPVSGPLELPLATAPAAPAPSAAPRPLAEAKQQQAAGQGTPVPVPGAVAGGTVGGMGGGKATFGYSRAAKRPGPAPPQAMIVECQVGPEAVRTRALEDLLARNGLNFRHGPLPKQFPQASAVYEVDATPAQVGLVLAQIAQNSATFHSCTIQSLAVAANREAADLDALRKSLGATQYAAPSGDQYRGESGATRLETESSNGSNHAGQGHGTLGGVLLQEERLRREKTAGEQPAAPQHAEGRAGAGGQGAVPSEPQPEMPAASRRALDKQEQAVKDQAPALAKGLGTSNGEESAKGGGGGPAPPAYRVVFVLRVVDCVPAASAAAPPSPAKPPAPAAKPAAP